MYKGISNAQRAANQRYDKEKTEAIRLRVPKGKKSFYQAAASAAGLSLNAFCIVSMDEKIERDTAERNKRLMVVR